MGRPLDEDDVINALRVAYWDDDIQSAKDDPCIVDAITDWAIRQVKALPSANPDDAALHESCADCPLYDHDRHMCPRFSKVIPTTIQEIRDTQPRMRGKWIDEKTNYVCSECHRGCWVNSDYCPWCGADMRKEVQDD